ncbi:thiol peroxidase [Actinotalea sp. M2MS4P-6]|uniref:thiol peroxidase n=1 Tax=Actinotalea sp. M2MS4P-6 TaxID=2983762 RepID=UPI0021E375E0|nr:thiol peroxidase [Actinotalea sp. M2MS4P-6]MCV2396068.1 thiol peroxidase [Actinotalea sp. M2MS4P-6]
MARTELRDGTEVHTVGDLPAVGSRAPEFTLTGQDLSDVSRPAGRVVLNIFPSLDTATCATSVRRFNQIAAGLDGTTVVCASMDLPYAMRRFCAAEGIDRVVVGSGFRSTFGTDFGVLMTDGAMRGLYARSVVVLDADGTVLHTQVVPMIGDEPDYDGAIAALG